VKGYKLLMDPVYEEFVLVKRGSTADELLKSSLLQRLRYIRQLGPCYLVYPGAEHTRFQHSLGVYWLSKKCFHFLRLKGFSIEPQVEEAVSLAALLHDVGHSPFSHALEGAILPTSHEEITLKGLELLREEFPHLEDELKEAKTVLEGTHPLPFTKQLVCSQLDCDRLDYLRRDAFFTGVSFGRIDVNRILASALIENGELVWSFKGFNALESYVMSRYQMYWTVYFHKVNVAAQVLLEKIILRLKELLRQGELPCCDPLLAKTLKEGSLEHFFRINDSNVVVTLYNCQNCKDRTLTDLCRRFVNRELFTTVEVKEPKELFRLKEKVERLGLNPDYYFEVVEPKKVAYSYYKPGGGEPIKVKLGEGQVEELSTVAPTDAIKALSREVKKTYAVLPREALLQ